MFDEKITLSSTSFNKLQCWLVRSGSTTVSEDEGCSLSGGNVGLTQRLPSGGICRPCE